MNSANETENTCQTVINVRTKTDVQSDRKFILSWLILSRRISPMPSPHFTYQLAKHGVKISERKQWKTYWTVHPSIKSLRACVAFAVFINKKSVFRLVGSGARAATLMISEYGNVTFLGWIEALAAFCECQHIYDYRSRRKWIEKAILQNWKSHYDYLSNNSISYGPGLLTTAPWAAAF